MYENENENLNLNSQINSEISQSVIPVENKNHVYRWNIEDERNFRNVRSRQISRKSKTGAGLKLFAAIMCVMFLFTAASTAYFVWDHLYGINENIVGESLGNSPAPVISNQSAVDETKNAAALNDPDGNNELESTAAVITQETQPSKILSTEEAIAKVNPSVVCIETETEVQGYSYFGRRNSASYIVNGVGTGFIVESNGYIATNYHVVSGADKIKVTLYNGETYEAELIGGDETADLAIIKISAKNLTAAELGDSDALVQGQDVVAIGTPAGVEFGWSATKGIVSSISRIVTVNDSSSYYSSSIAEREMEVIQTDASINPGNSGGPLINMKGQVIGINSMKLASADYEGMGFSIPINIAIPVFNEIIANPGVINEIPYVSDDFSAVSFGLTGDTVYDPHQGWQIDTIDENGPCYNSGLQIGDIIIALDGELVTSRADLLELKLKYKPGDKVIVTIYRNARLFDFEITFAAR